jgi:hypothetical protein
MSIQKLLFGIILFCVTLVALANLSSLVVSSAIYLPLLGVFQLPLLLIGLLGVVLTALVFFWAAKSSLTQAQAERVKDLEKLIDLQRVLDLRSKQERTTLQASLDSHANAILARLETLRLDEKFVPSSGNTVFHPALEEQFWGPYNREPHMDNMQPAQLQNNSLGLR